MKITADKEWRLAIQQLANIALRATGIDNLEWINTILSSIEDIEEPKKK